jgi:ribonuclease-3
VHHPPADVEQPCPTATGSTQAQQPTPSRPAHLNPGTSPTEPIHGGADQAARAVAWLADALGVCLPAPLLMLALTHRSWAYENGRVPTNERLEFLGDAVLQITVTEQLYRSQPDLAEGKLAKLRASVVNMTTLAKIARTLGDGGLGPHLLLGRGEEMKGGRDRDSILADAVEALLGAIHLHCGWDTAEHVVRRLCDPLLAHAATRGAALDWKTSLQELSVTLGLGPPSYQHETDGPDHARTYTAAVLLAGPMHGHGTARTKKAAEQLAAEAAYTSLAPQPPDDASTLA